MRRFVAALSLALALCPSVPSVTGAQPLANGRIVGRIVDQSTGAGMSDVIVQVVGTSFGALSGVDGRYTILNVPAGSVSLFVRRIGYRPKTITGLVLEAGQAVEQHVSLEVAPTELATQIVTADAERGSVNAALNAQRQSVNVVSAVTAEEIARTPDGDAAQAVARVSGVSVQDGKYVFVRGLGDRYTTTALNGARIPSPEPEKKVVPLDLFPTGLLQTITTVKTFTPDQPGDFSGAQVNIETKEFPTARTWAFSMSTGGSEAVLGRSILLPDVVSGDLVAHGARGRVIPSFVQAFGNFQSATPSHGDYNRMIAAFRNSWTPRTVNGAPNASFSASVGGNDPIPVLGHRIGYLVSGSYGYAQDAKLDRVRALAQIQSAEPQEVDRYEGVSSQASVTWGGLANFSTLLGSRVRLGLNNTYNRTMDSEARVEMGSSESDDADFQITRQKYVERSVRSSQLVLTSDVTARQRLNLAVTLSGVTRTEPDRSEFLRFRQRESANPFRWLADGTEGAVRAFSALTEDAWEASGSYRIELGAIGTTTALKVGGLLRHADRDATDVNYRLQAWHMTDADRLQPAEQIFQLYMSPTDSAWRLSPIQAGGGYAAEDILAAGFVMLEQEFGPRWQLITGARVEQSDVMVRAQPTIGAATTTHPTYTDVLPAVALTFRPGANTNVRLSASQTVSRPEYRELAPILYREVAGAALIQGNDSLQRALIQNYDLRWEWYPAAGEAYSIAVFAKQFTNPIERVYQGTSGTSIIRFVNAAGASNYGVEFEVRQGLDRLALALANYSVAANLTLMHSRIRLDDAGASTNPDRAMVGQASYMFNTALTWTSATGRASATLLYNVVGPRLTEAGQVPLPDVEEQARHVVDLALRLPVNEHVAATLDLKNLLDAPYQWVQGPVVRESYRTGRGIAVGLSYRP